MSGVIDQYRKPADKARADAVASLPRGRELHLNSAKRLDEIDLGLDSIARAKLQNDEAKLIATPLRPSPLISR